MYMQTMTTRDLHKTAHTLHIGGYRATLSDGTVYVFSPSKGIWVKR